MKTRKLTFISILLTSIMLMSCSEKTTTDSGMIRLLVGSYGSADKDRIRMYNFDQESGQSNLLCGLKGIADPSFLAITPNGKFLLCACRDSNIIQVFKRNADTGMLSETSCDIVMEQPVCVKFIVDSINK